MNNQYNQPNEIPSNQVSNNMNSNNTKLLNKRKRSKKQKWILIVLLIAIIIAGFVFTKSNTGKKILNNNQSNEIKEIKIETGKSWGDKFAIAVQTSFPDLTTFQVTFIDFNFDSTPEMIIRYKDKQDKDNLRIFELNNNEVSETKDFRSAELKMLYNLKDKNVNWYIYIANSNKYGAYTKIDKILNGTALDSDIKATTDSEIKIMNENYAPVDYKCQFSEINKVSLSENFKTAISKFDTYNKDVITAKEKTINDYATTKKEETIDTKNYIEVGEYTLKYGTYIATEDKIELGKVVGQNEFTITINKNGTITEGENTYKFNVYGKIFTLENMQTFEVTKDNVFTYGTTTKREYLLKE